MRKWTVNESAAWVSGCCYKDNVIVNVSSTWAFLQRSQCPWEKEPGPIIRPSKEVCLATSGQQEQDDANVHCPFSTGFWSLSVPSAAVWFWTCNVTKTEPPEELRVTCHWYHNVVNRNWRTSPQLTRRFCSKQHGAGKNNFGTLRHCDWTSDVQPGVWRGFWGLTRVSHRPVRALRPSLLSLDADAARLISPNMRGKDSMMTSEGVITPENGANDSGNVSVVAFGSFGVLTDSFLAHNSHMTRRRG